MIKLGNDTVKFNTFGIANTIRLSRMGKVFIEYIKDNGYVMALNEHSIDLFARETKSILEKLDLLYLIFGNANFGTTNLINPSLYKGLSVGGLIWSADGVQGNGVNGYIDTNFNPYNVSPVKKYTRNNACRGANVTIINGPGNTGWELDGGPSNSLMYLGDNVFKRINTTGNSPTSIDMSGTGLKVISRIESTKQYYINKDILSESMMDSTAVASANIYILRHTNFGNSKINLYLAGGSLTYQETQDFRTSFNKMLASNGLAQTA